MTPPPGRGVDVRLDVDAADALPPLAAVIAAAAGIVGDCGEATAAAAAGLGGWRTAAALRELYLCLERHLDQVSRDTTTHHRQTRTAVALTVNADRVNTTHLSTTPLLHT